MKHVDRVAALMHGNRDFSYLIQRLRVRYQRGRHEPAFQLVVLAILVGFAFGLTQAIFAMDAQWRSLWQEEAEVYATTEIEPRENTANVPLLTPIFASIEESQRIDQICDSDDASCRQSERARLIFRDNFAQALEVVRCRLEDAGDGGPMPCADAILRAKQAMKSRFGPVIAGQMIEALSRLSGAELTRQFGPCAIAPPGQVGQALCATGPAQRALVHLPVHIAQDVSRQPRGAEPLVGRFRAQVLPDRFDRAAREGMAAALALEFTISVLEMPQPSVARSVHRDHTQTYFINADGVLAFLSKEAPQAVFGKLPPSRYWPQARYFQAALNRTQRAKSTMPYLDLAGAGMVETVCERVDDLGSPEMVIGVICTDLAFTREATTLVLERLQQSATLNVVEVVVGGKSATYTDNAERSPAGDYAKQVLVGQGTDDSSYFTSMRAIDTPFGSKLHSVPVHRTADGKTVFWLLETKSPSMPTGTIVWICIASLTWALLLVYGAYCWHDTRIARNDGLRRTQLRSMQIGLIEADEDGRVVWGNDRAEEILFETLRGSPSPGQQVSRRLSVIATKTRDGTPLLPLLTRIMVKVRLVDGTPEFVPATPESIMLERQGGGISRYYGRRELHDPRQGAGNSDRVWVEVRAGPLFFGSHFGRKAISAFASFTPVKAEDDERLEELSKPKPVGDRQPGVREARANAGGETPAREQAAPRHDAAHDPSKRGDATERRAVGQGAAGSNEPSEHAQSGLSPAPAGSSPEGSQT